MNNDHNLSRDNNLFRSIGLLALTTGLLLMIPLIAMQFSTGVNWTLSDFVIAGILLFGTGLTYILVTRLLAPRISNNRVYRIAVGFALFTGLFLIWSNLAVGIIGSEDNPANVMYFGVPAVGIIGALMARFRSQGMVFTMFAMALAQALITVVVFVYGMYQTPPSTVFHILAVNGFFITLFVVSALLFRHAALEHSPTNNSLED